MYVDALAAKLGQDVKALLRILRTQGVSNPCGSTNLTAAQQAELIRWFAGRSDPPQSDVLPTTAKPPVRKLVGKLAEPLTSPYLASGVTYDWPSASDLSPYDHQIDTTRFLVRNARAFCLNDMGTGKTLSVLWAYDFLRRNDVVQSMLVICPLSTMRRTWADEIEKNFKGILRYKILHGSKASDRKNALDEKAHIYIINPDGLTRVEGMLDAFATRKDIDLVVVDEIAQSCRNAGTDRYRALLTLCNRQTPRWVFGMTGTPTPNLPTDAWAQCRLLVPERVPPYFNRFRDQVMRQINWQFWVPRSDATKIVYEAMQPSIRFTRDECIDLPPCIHETRQVDLSKEQEALYRKMLKYLHGEFDGKEISAPNEMVMTMKLLQIAAGAPYDINGDAVFPPMPDRLAAMLEIIEEAAGKVIVFVPFRGAITKVAEYLSEQKLAIAVVHGGVNISKRDEIFKDFQAADEPRVLIAQAQAMSHGLTLTAANTIIWFGPTTSADTYAQANARITRPGQTRTQLIVNMEGAEVERRIFDRLKNKLALQGVLLDLLAEQCGTRAVPKGHSPSGFEPFAEAPPQMSGNPPDCSAGQPPAGRNHPDRGIDSEEVTTLKSCNAKVLIDHSDGHSSEPEEAERLAAAESQLTSADDLATLAADSASAVRLAVAENTNCPGHLYLQLLEEGGAVEYAVRQNKAFVDSVIRTLAFSDDPAKRLAACQHIYCPIDVLESLESDPDRKVRDRVRSHPRLTTHRQRTRQLSDAELAELREKFRVQVRQKLGAVIEEHELIRLANLPDEQKKEFTERFPEQAKQLVLFEKYLLHHVTRQRSTIDCK